jgi:purine-binding chemotaxis protein CheW
MTDTLTEPAFNLSGDVRRGDGRYLTVTLGDETYALDIVAITEIIAFRPLTVVPMMPPFIRGVLNLRGRVLPVVDLTSRFGGGTTEVHRRTVVLVVETTLHGEDGSTDEVTHVGLIVDAVSKVVHLGEDDIEPRPAFGAGIRAEFISGMAKLDGDFVVVLDIDAVLRLGDMLPSDLTGDPSVPLGDIPQAG